MWLPHLKRPSSIVGIMWGGVAMSTPKSLWSHKLKTREHEYLTNVQSWNRRFVCETIHPTQTFTSMNLLQMYCVITWACIFLTSDVVEADRGQKHHISVHNLGTLTQRSVHPSVPVLFTKDLPSNEISYDFQPSFSLHISNSRTKPTAVLWNVIEDL